MDVMQAIKIRRSVREYSSKPIPADVLQQIRQALRYAPSACNLQPWHFILITEPDLRREVARVSREQMWMADAPVIVVACAYPEQAYKYMGGYGNSADIDAAIALDHLTLAAVAEGLGTCWIGAFSEVQVKKLLKIPDNVKVVAMTPLGYPTKPQLIHPLEEQKRKPEAEIFSVDYYRLSER